MSDLTSERIYWQAIQKARIISRRNLDAMKRGDRDDSGPCTIDLERQFIIEAIAKSRSLA